VSNEVDQLTAHAFKQKSIVVFNLPQIIHRGMDELQAHTNLAFHPFGLEDDGYSSSNFFTATPKAANIEE